MIRTKIKGNTGGSSSSEDTRVPNFDALPPLPVCIKRPSAILDAMENATNRVLVTPTMSMLSHAQLGNVTAGNNYQMMMFPRTESPCQFTSQDDAYQIPSPPAFHRSVSIESQFMMQPCIFTTMPFMNHHLSQHADHIEPYLAAEHQTSVHGPQHLEQAHDVFQDNLSDFSISSLQHVDDFEPLPFMDDSEPCDEFARFIEGAIQHIES